MVLFSIVVIWSLNLVLDGRMEGLGIGLRDVVMLSLLMMMLTCDVDL